MKCKHCSMWRVSFVVLAMGVSLFSAAQAAELSSSPPAAKADPLALDLKHEIWGRTYYGEGYVYGPTAWRSSMAVVDIDSDGDNDFAFRANYGERPQVMRNLGTANVFYPGGLKELNAPDPIPDSLFLDMVMDFGDVTGDGRPDLLAMANSFGPNETSLVWYKNMGPAAGAPNDEPQFVYQDVVYLSEQDTLPELSFNLADIDADGLLDICLVEPYNGQHYVLFIMNQGTAAEPVWGDAVIDTALTALMPPMMPAKAAKSGAGVDVRGKDPLRPVNAAKAGYSVRISDIELRDWTVDGVLDFLYYDAQEGMQWIRNAGTAEAPVWEIDEYGTSLEAYGIPAGHYEDEDIVYGTFAVRTNPEAFLPTAKWLDDFYINMDGRLISRRWFTGNDAGYRVTQENSLEFATGQGPAAFWDYDGDGDYDLFRTGIGSGSDSMMLLFPNVGTPYAPAWGKMVALDTAPLIYTGTYDNHYRQDLYTFADADADGLTELFVQQQDGTISAYQCYEGTDTIPPVFDWLQDDVAGIVLDGLSGVQPRGLALADFNYSQDGILELFAVYSSTDGGRMAYTVQDAAKDVTTWVAPTVGAAFLRDETGALMNANRVESLAAADLNRDGRPDLIVTLSDDLSVEGTYWECSQHVYLNTYNAESGNFSFVYSGRLDTPYETDNVGARMVSAIDIDADSDDDVFLGHQAYYPDSVGRRHYLRFYRNATDLNMAFWRTRAVSGQTWTLRVGDREPEYEWISNASGGSVEGAVYTAGPTGRVVDILQTTDAGYPYRVFIDVLPEVGEDESKAIIVVGGAGDDSLYPAFEDVAAYAYWVLRGEGLPPENIRMYAQNDFDADDDGISDVVGPPTLDALEESVTEWAVGADRLLVTLIDHGQRGRFRLNGVDYLDADEYAEWINELQPSGGGPQVTTVIDTCEAGSFIAPLALTKSAQKAGTKRITMTSSGVGPVDGVALFDNNHGISFSAAFWEEIFQGSSYGQAFEVAKVSIESINPLQDPQIDGDGDGVANGASDALAAYDARPGAAFEVVKAGVFIGDVADFLVTSTDSATLWLKNVVTDFPLEAAGALVVPPNFQRPTLNSDDEQPVTGMDWVQFTYNAELDRWQADYDGFTEGGMFRVQYYVKAAGRFHASTRIGTVDRIGAPDAWEADNTAATAKWLPINSVQGHNFDVASDEDWVRFTSPANMNGTIAIVSPGLNCRAVVELYKQSELDANPSAEPVREMTADKPGAEVVFDQFFASSEQYCLRIANNDPNVFGAGTSYMMLIAVGTGGDLIPTTLVVSVMDSAKAAPIVGAEVVFNKTVKGNTAGDGIVQFVCPTYGSYDIGASMTGYSGSTKSVSVNNLVENAMLYLNKQSQDPAISVIPDSWDFGSVKVSEFSDAAIVVTNTGGGTLTGQATVAAPFSIQSGGSYALQFGEQQTVTVRFSPVAEGGASAAVAFSGGNGATCDVTGVGATGTTVISVTPASHDFGEVVIGESADATFTVTNTGEGTLTGQVTTSNALFGVAAGGSYSLTAGQSQAVTIRFSPEAEGQLSATVNFSGALGATAQVSGVGKEKKRGCFGGTIAGPPAPPDEYGDLLVLTLIALTLFAVGRKNAPALRTAGPIRE